MPPAFAILHESIFCDIKHSAVGLRTTEINSEDINDSLDELTVAETTDVGSSVLMRQRLVDLLSIQ